MMKKSKWIAFVVLFVSEFCLAQKTQRMSIVEHPGSKRVDILINDSLFTSLLYADSLKKHILFPVNASGGLTVTRGYPIQPEIGDQTDHPHQVGIWFNYGDVNGADFWNNSMAVDTNKKSYGKIKLNRIEKIQPHANQVELKLTATWINPGLKPVLTETTRYMFSVEGDVRVIDRHTTLKAISKITFKDSKEGLFAIRVSRQLEHPHTKAVKIYTGKAGTGKVLDTVITTGKYQSSEGLSGEHVFGKRAKWMRLSGSIDKKPVSIAIIDHPENINYPAFWMARGYGLFAINPLGAEVYTEGKEKLNLRLKQGESITFKHRLILAPQLSEAGIERYSQSFQKQ